MGEPIGSKSNPVYIDGNGVPRPCEVEPQFTVTFVDSTDDTVISKISVLRGYDAPTPTPPEHDGLGFTKWEGNYRHVEKDETVYAKYDHLVTVRFYNTYDKKNLADEYKVVVGTIPPTPIAGLDGWTFRKWSDYSGNDIGPVFEDTEYFAHWKREIPFSADVPAGSSSPPYGNITIKQPISIPYVGYGVSADASGWVVHQAAPQHAVMIDINLTKTVGSALTLSNIGPLVDMRGDKNEWSFDAKGKTVAQIDNTSIYELSITLRKVIQCTVVWNIRGIITLYLGDPNENKEFDWRNLDVTKLNVGDIIEAPSAYGFTGIKFEVVDKRTVEVEGLDQEQVVTLQARYLLTATGDKSFTKKFVENSATGRLWKTSDIRTWLNGSFLDAFMLDSTGVNKTGHDLDQAIAFLASIQKPNLYTYLDSTAAAPEMTNTDKVWLPSLSQVGVFNGGKTYSVPGPEGDCFEIYSALAGGTGAVNARIRLYTYLTGATYWLRSIYSTNATNVCYVSSNGSVSYGGITNANTIAPCITITSAKPVEASLTCDQNVITCTVSKPTSGYTIYYRKNGETIWTRTTNGKFTALESGIVFFKVEANGYIPLGSGDTFGMSLEKKIVPGTEQSYGPFETEEECDAKILELANLGYTITEAKHYVEEEGWYFKAKSPDTETWTHEQL